MRNYLHKKAWVLNALRNCIHWSQVYSTVGNISMQRDFNFGSTFKYVYRCFRKANRYHLANSTWHRYWTIKLVKYQGILIFMKITLATCELCKHIRDCEKYKFSRIHYNAHRYANISDVCVCFSFSKSNISCLLVYFFLHILQSIVIFFPSGVPLSFKGNFHSFQFLGVGFYLCALAKIIACDITLTLATFHMYHTWNVKK